MSVPGGIEPASTSQLSVCGRNRRLSRDRSSEIACSVTRGPAAASTVWLCVARSRIVMFLRVSPGTKMNSQPMPVSSSESSIIRPRSPGATVRLRRTH